MTWRCYALLVVIVVRCHCLELNLRSRRLGTDQCNAATYVTRLGTSMLPYIFSLHILSYIFPGSVDKMPVFHVPDRQYDFRNLDSVASDASRGCQDGYQTDVATANGSSATYLPGPGCNSCSRRGFVLLPSARFHKQRLENVVFASRIILPKACVPTQLRIEVVREPMNYGQSDIGSRAPALI